MLLQLLPVWITTLLLTAMLTFMTYRLLVKAGQTYRQESELLLKLAAKHYAKRHAAATAAATAADGDAAAADDCVDDDENRIPEPNESTPLLPKNNGIGAVNKSGLQSRMVSSARPLAIKPKPGSSRSRNRYQSAGDPSLIAPLLNLGRSDEADDEGSGDTRSSRTAPLDQHYSSSLPAVVTGTATATAAATATAGSYGRSSIVGYNGMRRNRSLVEVGSEAGQQRGPNGLSSSVLSALLIRGGHHTPRLHSFTRAALTTGQSFSLFQVREVDHCLTHCLTTRSQCLRKP
jgi:hypothetical protein